MMEMLDELVALYRSAKGARETFSEAVEAQAAKHNLARRALRRVVAAMAEEKEGDLSAEAEEILAILRS